MTVPTHEETREDIERLTKTLNKLAQKIQALENTLLTRGILP